MELYDPEQEAFKRQLAFSDALRKSAVGNDVGKMVGNIYVRKSPWVNAIEGLVGGYTGAQAEQGQMDLQGRRDTEFNALMANRPSVNKQLPMQGPTEEGDALSGSFTQRKSPDEYNTDVEAFGTKLLGSRDSRAQAVAGQILTRSLEHPYKQMEREQNQQQLTEAFRKYQEQNAPAASPAPIAAPGLAPPLMPTGQDKPWQPSDIAPGSKVAPQDADRAAIIQNELNNPTNQANPEAWAALVKEGASLGLAPQAPTAAPAAAPAAAKKPALPLSTHMYLTGGPEGQKLAAFLAPGERQEGKQNFTINNIQPFQAGQQTQRLAATSAENDKKIAAKVITPYGDVTKSGQEFLESLSPAKQEVVKGLVNYTVDPKVVSTKGGEREATVAAAKRVDPNFDTMKYGIRYGVVQEFTKGKTADNIVALDQAINHMGTLGELAKALNNGDITPVNYITTLAKSLFGQNAPTDAALASQAVGEELMRVFRQVGASEREATDWEAKMKAGIKSPQQMVGAITTASELLNGRIKALNNKWNNGMGTTGGYPNILSEEARGVLAAYPPPDRSKPPSALPGATAAAKDTPKAGWTQEMWDTLSDAEKAKLKGKS